MPDKIGYDTLDAAAAAALAAIREQEHSDKREFIGLIYQDPKTGKYLFTDPQTQGGPRAKGKSKGTFTLPAGSLRGIIHNHPEGGDDKKRSYLSNDDIEMAQKLNVPSYIGVDGILGKWDPKQGQIQGTGRRRMGVTVDPFAKATP